ncbi:MAG TPA: Xaa-Pro peptidase family protein [Candidatus Dormibacteraeota bacterium]|nr:Xaa-Pro peptidase family protein [Candidatus Dormibacteraeota bacterium]
MALEEPFAERCRRAAAAAASLGAECLLASDHGTVRWLTGRESEIGWGPLYPISAGTHVLLDGDGRGRIFCPEGEEEDGPAVSGLEVVTYPGYTLTPLRAYQELRGLLEVSARLAIEPHALPVALLPSTVTVDATTALASLRLRKDPAEIARVERAARVASVGQRTFRACAAPGMTEIEVFSALHAAMEKEAGTRVPVLPDLISGPRMLLVGVPPSNRRLEAGDLALADLVVRVDGYWADSCTTICLGKPTDEMLRLHDACVRALEMGIEMLRPGTVAGELDSRVRSAMKDAGYEYPHHTGHGVGVSFHEEPRIVPGADIVLEEGMVVALEPAGFGPGIGCRTEHLMVVTPSGGRVLTDYPFGLQL